MDIHQQSVKYRLLAVCLVGLLGAELAIAAQRQYETEVVVQSQAPAVRDAAMKTALRQVLSRVTTDRAALQTEPVQALLEKPSRVVQQYRYFTVPNSQPPKLKLWVRFDGNAIQQSLHRQGGGYTAERRPDTLVWLAVDEGGRHYLVSADDETEVRRQSTAAAQARGVPIVFPLMDLQDQSAARFADIWEGSFDQVLRASQRYNPQAVLIGRLQRSPAGGWSALWFLDHAGRTSSWSGSGGQMDALLGQGMAAIAGGSSAVTYSGYGQQNSNALDITVSGIRSLDAYARTNGYLGSLSGLRDFQIIAVNGSEIEYRLYPDGSAQELMQTVASGTVLEPAAGPSPGQFRLRQ